MNNEKINKKPSSKDVAELAGVSRATVSRAYNPDYNLDETLKKRVLEASKTLGYMPNMLARSLQTNRTNIVGILVRNISNPFYSIAINNLIYKLQEEGFQSLVFVSENTFDIDSTLEKALQYQVDAMIVFSAVKRTKAIKELMSRGVPTILFNRYIEDSGASSVCLNDMSMGRKIANELYSLGHKIFCFISADESASTVFNRKIGFISGLEALGVKDYLIIEGGFSYESGVQSARDMMAQNPSIDACFCCSDEAAFGFVDCLRDEFKKCIPEDISIIGFDNLPLASNPHYNLSTVAQPWEQLVQATVETVKERISNSSIPPITKVIEGTYIARKTTRER